MALDAGASGPPVGNRPLPAVSRGRRCRGRLRTRCGAQGSTEQALASAGTMRTKGKPAMLHPHIAVGQKTEKASSPGAGHLVSANVVPVLAVAIYG